MTPLIFAILAVLGILLLALAIYGGSAAIGASAAIFFLLISFGLFSTGLEETATKTVVQDINQTEALDADTNVTLINGTTSQTETTVYTESRGVLPDILGIVFLGLALISIYLIFLEE